MRIRTILILFATTQCVYSPKPETTTLKIEERIRLLKNKLRESLRNPPKPDPTPAYDDSDENAPIPPILEDDALKKDERYRLKTIKKNTPKSMLRTIKTRKTKAVTTKKVTFTTSTNVSQVANEQTERLMMSSMTPTMHLTTGSSPLDIFYRRSFLTTPLKWLHCSELITPYIKGAKKELSKPKLIRVNDHLVTRFLQLLSSNTTKLTRAERKSIMYQISILNVRLFSWDVNAVTALLDVIVKAGGSTDKPTFANLKAGMQALLALWTTDLSNTTTLLLHSRIFRPPCFQRGDAGSSKFVRGSTVPVRTVRQGSSDEDCFFGDNSDCRH